VGPDGAGVIACPGAAPGSLDAPQPSAEAGRAMHFDSSANELPPGGSRVPFRTRTRRAFGGGLRAALGAFALALLGACAASGPPGITPPRAMPAARAALQPEYRLFYDVLSDYGDWVLVEPRGFVFRPRVDPVWWRPYYDGYWSATDTYGWVWNSADAFGWATDHYGRWFYDDFQGWVWTPGLEWGPAWVAWRMGDDLVGWAPLPLSGTDGWSDRVPNGPYLYASTGELAHGDLRARLKTVREVGEAAMEMRPVEREAVRDGVRFPLGPPIERVERAYGFPIPRARIEELLPSGAATLRTAAGDAGRPAAPDSTREPLLRSTLDEIRRAAELAARDNRDVTGRQSPPPLRVPVLRAFGPASRPAAAEAPGAPRRGGADSTRTRR